MTSSISYPSFLEKKLAGNREMRGAIDATVVVFESWLQDSKLPFFPDYTDHGPTHLAEVLQTASQLIRPQARSLFTPEDAAVLILAVLLHDAALHLSESGFRELIWGKAAKNKIPDFDQADWPDLWSNFLFEAKHWDDHKLIDVLGAIEPTVPIASVSDPFERYDDLRETDRKLIGEFIRRHHPRLAHEFAVFGVPGPGRDPIAPSQDFGREKLDIAGLVARSHGLPLRNCLTYLADRHHRREFQQVHAVFLMSLLRVADYIQIQSSRSSPAVFRYKKISSPRSELEQRTHQAIKNITWSGEDPESIEVQADPPNIEVFLRLQEWLTGIQQELDSSWAVMGEVYGSDKRLAKLGLVIRRVRSNLDDVQSLKRRTRFLPERIEFDLAHAEVMKLLIRPLYGDEPSIGIRELMQNAVDAVRELWSWRERHSGREDILLVEQDGDVVIWLDEKSGTLTVSDQGIGMTEEVIRDFFLKVGASFRNSHRWQKEFETTLENNSHHSSVLRSGRFGVGVLAAFLLGDELEVSTRYVDADRGISFRTRLNAGPIELRYDETLKVGTTIKVQLGAVTLNDKEWDWYCFESPRVVRRKGPKGRILPQDLVAPDGHSYLPLGWYKTQFTEFDVYVGTSAVEGSRESVPLICNGIKIGDSGHALRSPFGRGEFKLASPSIVVIDPDGKLPLNLQRTNLTERAPFTDAVEKTVCESILAGLLLNTPANLPLRSHLDYLLPRFYRSWEEMVSFSPWLLTREGISLSDGWNVLQMGADRVLVTFADGLRLIHSAPCVLEGTFIYGEDSEFEMLLTGGVIPNLDQKGVRLLVTAQYGKRILRWQQGNSLLQYFVLAEEWTNGIWSLLTNGECSATSIALDRLPKPGRRASIWPVAVEWFFGSKDVAPRGLPGYWQEVLRDPIIPFNLEERRKRLAHAYATLAAYFEEHQNISKLRKPTLG